MADRGEIGRAAGAAGADASDLGAAWLRVEGMLAAIRGELDARNAREREEIRALADIIRDTRKDVLTIDSAESLHAPIPEATDELDAIVKAAEAATHEIMDAAEAIDALAAEAGGENAGRIGEQVIKIFEACSFQDITGQRAAKVVGALREIERRIDGLLATAGVSISGAKAAPAIKEKAATDDGDLLSGPQLPEDAKTQAEIDKLFSSLD